MGRRVRGWVAFRPAGCGAALQEDGWWMDGVRRLALEGYPDGSIFVEVGGDAAALGEKGAVRTLIEWHGGTLLYSAGCLKRDVLCD